jgi:two-component system, OmpR family, sensor histidine kinase KdpD
VRTVLLEAGATGLTVLAARDADVRMEPIELAAAQWVQDTGQPAGRDTATLTASDWQFRPLGAEGKPIAVLGIAREEGGDPLRADQLPLLMGLIDQASLALERLRLADEMRDVDAVRERDRLRAALLSSVGHDLRTPLTAILAATAEWRRAPAPELVDTVAQEALRLDRFVANLLDMARVEAGAIRLNVEAIDLTDAIGAAVHDARVALGGHPVTLEVPPNLPLVRVDAQLFHHCLLNLLDNAGRYGDPGTPVTIRGARTSNGIDLSVLDEGPGLPAEGGGAVFDTFRRLRGSDRTAGGTGLGLAIVKGFAEAMGLSVAAANRSDVQGARLSLIFPDALLVREREEEA